MVKFTHKPADLEIIYKIADRAHDAHGFDRQSTLMDISATHANGCRLRLKELLEADDFNFLHDVCGIARHIDRETGKIGGCFSPRFSR